MWLQLQTLLCGMILIIVVGVEPHYPEFKGFINRFFPQVNQDSIEKMYRHYVKNGATETSNPGTFFGFDREKARKMYNGYVKYRAKNHQQGKNHGGKPEKDPTNDNDQASPDNFFDFAHWMNNMENQNKSDTDFSPIKSRFRDDEDDFEKENTSPPATDEELPTTRPKSKSPKPKRKPKPKPTPTPKINTDTTPDSAKECILSETYVEGEHPCKSQLIFFENFTTLNRDIWNVEHIFAGAPDYGFVIYVDRPDTREITNYNLIIIPAKTEDIFSTTVLTDGLDLGETCTGRPGPPDCKMMSEGGFAVPLVSSARLNTKNKFSFKYGNIEIRAKFPLGDWLYPILYLNPSSETYGKYYDSGQIRIAFTEGNENNNKVLKGGIILGDSDLARNYFMKNATRDTSWGDTYHTYQLQWRPERITMSVDGEVYGKIEPPSDGFLSLATELKISHAEDWKKGSKLAPFDKEMYFQIGVGVGGLNFLDREDGSKPWKNRERLMMKKFNNAQDEWFPTWDEGSSSLKIDYIKVSAL